MFHRLENKKSYTAVITAILVVVSVVGYSMGELIVSSITSPVSTVRLGNRDVPVVMYVTNTGSRDIWLDTGTVTFAMENRGDVSSFYTVKLKSPRALIIPRNTHGAKVEFLVDISTAAPTGSTTIDCLLVGWENIIPNGSFEETLPEPSSECITPHWYHWPSSTSYRRYELDTDAVHGNYSYKISFVNASYPKEGTPPEDRYATVNTGGESGGRIIDFSLLLPVEGGTRYVYGMRYKDSFYYGVDRFHVCNEYDEYGNNTRPQGYTFFRYIDSRSWLGDSVEFTTTLTTKYVRVWFAIELRQGASEVTGSFWVDEMWMRSLAADPIRVSTATVKAIWEVIEDTVPPAAVNDLSAEAGSRHGEVKLSWTAPGDSGMEGTAFQYDIRYAKTQVTESNWSSATKVLNPPTPIAAGNKQLLTITGLEPGTTYYFAIKTRDFAGNWSGISNSPSAAAYKDTTEPTTPGRPVDQGDSTDIATQLEFSWTPSTDPESDIVKYILVLYVDAPSENNIVTTVEIAPQEWEEEVLGGITYIKFIVRYNFTRGRRYFAKVKARNAAGLESGYSEASDGILVRGEMLPPTVTENKLYPPYPVSLNPLKDEKVTIKYDVSEESKVTIKIYNIFGELVRTLVNNEMKNGPASYQELWDGRNEKGDVAANGIYIVYVKIGSYVQTKKILLVKQ